MTIPKEGPYRRYRPSDELASAHAAVGARSRRGRPWLVTDRQRLVVANASCLVELSTFDLAAMREPKSGSTGAARLIRERSPERIEEGEVVSANNAP